MQLVDTHSHMYAEQFGEDLDACMQRAIEAGVLLTLLPNIDEGSIGPMKALCAKYPNRFRPMMGLHPCSVGLGYEGALERIEYELNSGDYCAVGEIGIDLYWDRTWYAQQVEAFSIQIGWAKSKGLPIAIHARDSFSQICEVLDSTADDNLSGVFHCFTGSPDDARRALGFKNFYLGIGGVVTFKNGALDKVVEAVGIERMVLETDAPYLAPMPHRGKRNETAYTRLVAERLAELSGLSLARVAEITTRNAKELFRLDAI